MEKLLVKLENHRIKFWLFDWKDKIISTKEAECNDPLGITLEAIKFLQENNLIMDDVLVTYEGLEELPTEHLHFNL